MPYPWELYDANDPGMVADTFADWVYEPGHPIKGWWQDFRNTEYPTAPEPAVWPLSTSSAASEPDASPIAADVANAPAPEDVALPAPNAEEAAALAAAPEDTTYGRRRPFGFGSCFGKRQFTGSRLALVDCLPKSSCTSSGVVRFSWTRKLQMGAMNKHVRPDLHPLFSNPSR